MKRAVIVTGAAGGIGEEVCRRMAADGYLVLGVDLEPAPSASIEYRADLCDTEQLSSLGADLARKFELKAIIHNAAVQPLAGAGETTVADWLETLRVNVMAVDAFVSGTRKNLMTNDGSVVVVTSVHARATTNGIAAYATSKAALEGWVRAAALDLGPGVRVNAVAPGAIDTAKLRDGFARWGTEAAEQRLAVLCERTALRRIGTPGDVAGAVSFLVGDDAKFVTGSVLVVDGGATARLGSE